MGIDDSLLKSSVHWRGTPDTYVSGSLEAQGRGFSAAFNSFAAVSGIPTEIAFEFFTGLVFNANYRTLSGLRNVVDRWLKIEGDVLLNILQDFRQTRPQSAPHTASILTFHAGWYPLTLGEPNIRDDHIRYECLGSLDVTGDFWSNGTHYFEPLGIGQFRYAIWKHFGDFYSEPVLTCNIELPGLDDPRFIAKFTAEGIVGEPLDQIATDGKPLTLPLSYTPYQVDPPQPMVEIFWKGERDDLPIPYRFKDEVKLALGVYAEGEQSYKREYPSVEETATADNGYVFNSWAEGKFGLPGVYGD